MHLDKVTTLLKPFDKPRLKLLNAFVQSSYFRVPPISVALLQRLIPLHPAFPHHKMQPAKLGKNSPTLSTLSKQCNAGSYLVKAIENFIAQEEWQKDKAAVTRYCLKGFKQLHLDEGFNRSFKKEMQRLDKCPEQNFDTFFEKHLLTELSFNGLAGKQNRTLHNDIMPVVKTLDEFHALKKLRYLCEALNRQQGFATPYDARQVPQLLTTLQPYTNTRHPYVFLFVNAYRMMEETVYAESRLYYLLLKQFIEARPQSPLPQGIREVVDYMFSYCMRWHNKGYDEAGSEYLGWIAWKEKNNLLLHKDVLMPVTFRNIVSIAVLTKVKPAVIEKMISTYSPFLPPEAHDTFLAFARGLYQYTMGKYKEATRFFLMAQAKEDVNFNSTIRRWQWMCAYELDCNDTDTLHNQLLAFEKHLSRNKKELQQVAPLFQRFINYCMNLLKGAEEEKLSICADQLQNEEHFPGKPWLVQQFASKNKKTRSRSERVK